MMSTHPSPHFRKAPGLLIQHIGLETLVYHEKIHTAFCLNATAAQVWGLLDGVRTTMQIAAAASVALRAPVSEELVLFTISELRRDGLLDEKESAECAFIAPTRRDLIRQLSAGAIVMLPTVAAILAPKAAQAYNGCVDCDLKGKQVARRRQGWIAQQQLGGDQQSPSPKNPSYGSKPEVEP